MKSLCKCFVIHFEGQSRLQHIKPQKVRNNAVENRLNYYLGLCELTTEIIENEGECLVTANFFCQLENEPLYADSVRLCACVCLYFSQENTCRVKNVWVCLCSPAG